jgi:hypothetical protein
MDKVNCETRLWSKHDLVITVNISEYKHLCVSVVIKRYKTLSTLMMKETNNWTFIVPGYGNGIVCCQKIL